MSKIALSGNASGTGTFTIASPNSNSDRTLNLPDNSGTLLSNASTTGFPAGSVLQVVQGSLPTSVSTSSASLVSTGLAATITPSSATSKILVLVASNADNIIANRQLLTTVYRNATSLLTSGSTSVYAESGRIIAPIAFTVLDSPSTTSATTYTVYFSSSNIAGSVTFNQASGGGPVTATITLMEIAA